MTSEAAKPSTVNPCDPVDERTAAGFTLDEERIVREIREACAYSRAGVPQQFIDDGNAVRQQAADELKSFRACELTAAALHVDDMLAAHPEFKPEAVLKETAHALISLATMCLVVAKRKDGGTFEPSRVALAAYEWAHATMSDAWAHSNDPILGFDKPGTLRQQFEEQATAEGFISTVLPEPFPLTEQELLALADDPGALRVLIDYHESQVAEAEAKDSADMATENEARRKQFEALRDAAQTKRAAQ